MNPFFAFIVFTFNSLGSFNDPFEFAGDYGAQANQTRDYVFEKVVSKEALAKHLTDQELQQLVGSDLAPESLQAYRQVLIQLAAFKDQSHGPTLGEVIDSNLLNLLLIKQTELAAQGFTQDQFNQILRFIADHRDLKLFSFFQTLPPQFLSLDKKLKDFYLQKDQAFPLPILSSTVPFQGSNKWELKQNLFNQLFTLPHFNLALTTNSIHNSPSSLLDHSLPQDLAFSPAGQLFIYGLYQAMLIDLVAEEEEEIIRQINKTKQHFHENLSDPFMRANWVKTQLQETETSVFFVQESNQELVQALTKDGSFWPVDKQNSLDGTFVFLKTKDWEPNAQIISIEDYEGYSKGRLNVLLATRKETQEKFLLASAHGHSTNAEDGRHQIFKIKEKWNKLVQDPENEHLQLLIGIDANTKSEHDCLLLQEHLENLGLLSTHLGPTTLKKRMVTVQHSKAGRSAEDEEDYLIILNPSQGGKYSLHSSQIGFKPDHALYSTPLPHLHNLSDHYPVGANLQY